MKILGISGGMRNGSNDGMCIEALMGAKEMGAEVEFIQLQNLHIEHCTGCTACVQSVLGGRGGKCVLKDDFDWLLDKMLDADGIVFSTPIFEKGATGLFHTITDRFGPRMDRGNNIIGTKIAEETGRHRPRSPHPEGQGHLLHVRGRLRLGDPHPVRRRHAGPDPHVEGH